jgi:hypothetical protein
MNRQILGHGISAERHDCDECDSEFFHDDFSDQDGQWWPLIAVVGVSGSTRNALCDTR